MSRIPREAPFDAARMRREKHASGRPLCRWCGGPCEGRRTSWCSDPCVDEWMVRVSPGYVRQKLAERDLGMCAACGLHTTALDEWLKEQKPDSRKSAELSRAWRAMFSAAMGTSYTRTPIWLRLGGGAAVSGYWDADHILPVAEGGGGCGLDNYQTLCIPCHKAKTSSQALRAAEARKKQLSLLPVIV